MVRRARRTAVAAAAAIALLAALAAAPAAAHPLSTSSILLDVRGDEVGGEVQLPIDRLAVALDRPIPPAEAAGGQRESLERYVAAHVSARGADGRPWRVRLGRSAVRKVDRVDHLVVPLSIVPPGDVTDFRLRYDAIVEGLPEHRVFVAVRTHFEKGVVARDAQHVGVFDRDTAEMAVPAGGGSWLRGMAAAARLGVEHVAEGADHLLFLLMLLLPAPLVAVGDSWRRGPSVRRGAVRVVHVVTAFAAGHTTTLLLAGLGVLELPARPVETLIAFSITVGAVHAMMPLVDRGEVIIAAAFGLVHGLAFATLIGDLGLGRGSLVSSLLGFNLGVEVAQLLVVALVMPSLVVLSRTPWYTPLRLALATVALALSAGWMLERTALLGADPSAPATQWLVDRPLLLPAALALLAVAAARATSAGRSRATPAAARER